jgi:hypothetical protein
VIPRITFLFIAAFWVTMNILLWRAEYGLHGGEMPVPADLVWRKILTASDTSSLTIYQDGQISGFCEFSTSIGQAMAKLDENSLPPEGLVARAGYQIHLKGNTSLGNFTNRVRFNGRLQFSSAREWRELNLKIISSLATVEIHSLATNQSLQLTITSGGATVERDLAFADLQNPDALLQIFGENFGGGFFGGSNLSVVPQIPNTTALAQSLHWQATRVRLTIGHESVFVYRLETQLLQNKIVIYVSTLGEILRVELPGGITAALDEWSKP